MRPGTVRDVLRERYGGQNRTVRITLFMVHRDFAVDACLSLMALLRSMQQRKHANFWQQFTTKGRVVQGFDQSRLNETFGFRFRYTHEHLVIIIRGICKTVR